MPNVKPNFYEVITPPDTNIEVVDRNLVVSNGNMDDSDPAEQALIDFYITAAEDRIEALTGRTLRPTTFRLNAPYGALSQYERYSYVEVERAPISAITTVEQYDGNAFVTTDTDDYIIEQKAAYWRILFKDFDYQTLPDDVAYPIRITFDAGYADGTVPKKLQLAVVQYATWLYTNRGDCSEEELPPALKSLIGQCRIIRTFA